jgi:hypothetical protein
MKLRMHSLVEKLTFIVQIQPNCKAKSGPKVGHMLLSAELRKPILKQDPKQSSMISLPKPIPKASSKVQQRQQQKGQVDHQDVYVSLGIGSVSLRSTGGNDGVGVGNVPPPHSAHLA